MRANYITKLDYRGILVEELMATQKTRLLIPVEKDGSQPEKMQVTQNNESTASNQAEPDYKNFPFIENWTCSNPTCNTLIPSTCEERVRISPDKVVTVTTCPNCQRKYRLT